MKMTPSSPFLRLIEIELDKDASACSAKTSLSILPPSIGELKLIAFAHG
ncbi:hypothetical protein [Paenibacillus herberti]|nr:hypothetical protein [Paenibacillus herberti]